MKKIAIQGIRGSYHDMAAHRYFKKEKDIELVCCDTFPEVFRKLSDDSETVALVAIENTIAGSLLQNYELIRKSGSAIVGEIKLRISHSLLCLPNEDWDDIQEINSHPVALMQCREFLEEHPKIKVVEAADTAGSARMISEGKMKGHAAICSKFAAPLYGMKVLQEGIETNKHNFTRFLVLADKWKTEDYCDLHHTNKASLVFSLPDEMGALSKILSIFSFYQVNLTKIQSLPIIGREWEYLFYVDVSYKDYMLYHQSLDAVEPLIKELKILGEYEEGISTI